MVLAVPGPITSSLSAGANQLLRNGAHAVTSAAEVVEAVGELGADLAPVPRAGTTELDHLDSTSRAVVDALPGRGAMSAAELARNVGIAPADVVGCLALLELDGLVRRRADGWCLVRRALPRGAPN